MVASAILPYLYFKRAAGCERRRNLATGEHDERVPAHFAHQWIRRNRCAVTCSRTVETAAARAAPTRQRRAHGLLDQLDERVASASAWSGFRKAVVADSSIEAELETALNGRRPAD